MQHRLLSTVRPQTLFVFTGNPINPSRKKASAYTMVCQAQTSWSGDAGSKQEPAE